MAQEEPEVTLILLSWDRKNEILEILGELQNQIYKNFEILVVDQGSAGRLTDEIQAKYPKIRLIKLKNNIGVPGGRNIGVQNAKGNILFFLDNDAILDCRGLKITVEKFKENPEVGIIGCQMLNYTSNELDKNLWIYPVPLAEYANREFDFYTYCGGGCAIRREVFSKVGLFWDDLFFGCEEIDYGIRAMDRGYRILYSPEIKVLHRDSCERKISPVERDCYLLRNTLGVGWRLFPAIASLRLTFVTIITYLIRSVRYKYSGRMLAVVIKSFKKINLLWDNSCRIKSGTYKKYRQLSREGSFLARAKIILFAK